MNKPLRTSIEVLLAEDDPSDIRTIRDTLREDKSLWRLNIVQDGIEATEFLLKRGKYQEAPTPRLVILDLNMPKKSGKEVLIEMKSNDKLMHIPVLIFSTSEKESDVFDCYSLQACGYVTKPMGRQEFIEKIRDIENYWTRTCCLSAR